MVMTQTRRRLRIIASLCLLVLLATLGTPSVGRTAVVVDEIHYTFTGATSVAFDWRGSANDLRYGLTSAYGATVLGHQPSPLPFSSSGPFWEAQLTGLAPGTAYHYSIGGGPDHMFSTAPNGNFRFAVIGDVGDSTSYDGVAPTQSQIAADNPAFVLVTGDLTYGNDHGQQVVDQHFNDVMVWSQTAAYMPAWGNHEWDNVAFDDLRNYKGRFAFPNPQTSPNAPTPGCCGEDWSWFDAGGVRFITYPEPFTGAWSDWQAKADPIMAAAQADPSIHFIATAGHTAQPIPPDTTPGAAPSPPS
jgi:Calcineurin-like phosphoesterase